MVRASKSDVVEDGFLESGTCVEFIDHSIWALGCLSGDYNCFRDLVNRGSKSRVGCLVRRSKKSEGPPPCVGHTKIEQGRQNGNKRYDSFVVAVE